MFDVLATINTPTREYDDVAYMGVTLNDVWELIKEEYPDVTSVVLVFSKPKD